MHNENNSIFFLVFTEQRNSKQLLKCLTENLASLYREKKKFKKLNIPMQGKCFQLIFFENKLFLINPIKKRIKQNDIHK